MTNLFRQSELVKRISGNNSLQTFKLQNKRSSGDSCHLYDGKISVKSVHVKVIH